MAIDVPSIVDVPNEPAYFAHAFLGELMVTVMVLPSFREALGLAVNESVPMLVLIEAGSDFKVWLIVVLPAMPSTLNAFFSLDTSRTTVPGRLLRLAGSMSTLR